MVLAAAGCCAVEALIDPDRRDRLAVEVEVVRKEFATGLDEQLVGPPHRYARGAEKADLLPERCGKRNQATHLEAQRLRLRERVAHAFQQIERPLVLDLPGRCCLSHGSFLSHGSAAEKHAGSQQSTAEPVRNWILISLHHVFSCRLEAAITSVKHSRIVLHLCLCPNASRCAEDRFDRTAASCKAIAHALLSQSTKTCGMGRDSRTGSPSRSAGGRSSPGSA
jgi:hypothetical protein